MARCVTARRIARDGAAGKQRGKALRGGKRGVFIGESPVRN